MASSRFARLSAVFSAVVGVAVLARRLAAKAVDRPVTGGCDDPPGRARRHPGRWPALHGGRERVLDRLLGHVDVTEDAYQDRHCAAVLCAEDTFNLRSRKGIPGCYQSSASS